MNDLLALTIKAYGGLDAGNIPLNPVADSFLSRTGLGQVCERAFRRLAWGGWARRTNRIEVALTQQPIHYQIRRPG
jgi:hypothetical protein